MAKPITPLIARRKLGAELRALRDQHGLTTEDVAGELGCHNSKVSRTERGQRPCTRTDFKKLMELYDVDQDRAQNLKPLLLASLQRLLP